MQESRMNKGKNKEEVVKKILTPSSLFLLYRNEIK